MTYKDEIVMTVTNKFSFMDRLKILFGFQLVNEARCTAIVESVGARGKCKWTYTGTKRRSWLMRARKK